MPTFSRSLEQSLHRALALANERHHEYATLEHLLLALIEDQDAAAVERHIKGYFAAHKGGLPAAGLYDRVLRKIERPLIVLTLGATRTVPLAVHSCS